MKESKQSERPVSWDDVRAFGETIEGSLTDEHFRELERLFSELDLTTIPDDVRFPDEVRQRQVERAKSLSK